VDEEIEKALADTPRAGASDSLAALKKKMGIAEGSSEKS
jgi:hypothetical protein